MMENRVFSRSGNRSVPNFQKISKDGIICMMSFT